MPADSAIWKKLFVPKAALGWLGIVHVSKNLSIKEHKTAELRAAKIARFVCLAFLAGITIPLLLHQWTQLVLVAVGVGLCLANALRLRRIESYLAWHNAQRLLSAGLNSVNHPSATIKEYCAHLTGLSQEIALPQGVMNLRECTSIYRRLAKQFSERALDREIGVVMRAFSRHLRECLENSQSKPFSTLTNDDIAAKAQTWFLQDRPLSRAKTVRSVNLFKGQANVGRRILSLDVVSANWTMVELLGYPLNSDVPPAYHKHSRLGWLTTQKRIRNIATNKAMLQKNWELALQLFLERLNTLLTPVLQKEFGAKLLGINLDELLYHLPNNHDDMDDEARLRSRIDDVLTAELCEELRAKLKRDVFVIEAGPVGSYIVRHTDGRVKVKNLCRTTENLRLLAKALNKDGSKTKAE